MPFESELARRVEGRIEIRPGAQRVEWYLTGLDTSDGHVAEGVFSCSVRALPDANERRMLEESLMGSGMTLTVAQLANHFQNPLLTAARRYSRARPAQDLLADEGRREFLEALIEAGQAVAFACGVEMLPPAQLDLDCPTLARQKIETRQRQEAEQRAADQVGHLRRSAELFSQFESIRASAPELSPGQVLGRLGLTDQSEALRSLLLASAGKSRKAALWAVAGESLIEITGDVPAARVIPVPTMLGPLRSVRGDGTGALLLGCRAGMIRIDPKTPDQAVIYSDPEITSQLGFNSAVLVGDFLWAAHREAGVVGWKVDAPQKPTFSVRPAAAPVANFAPRNLIRLNSGKMLVSSGPLLLALSLERKLSTVAEPSSADIAAIIAGPERVLTVHEDGTVCVRDRESLKIVSKVHRSGRVCSAGALPWMGDTRILLAAEDGPINCAGADDDLITQYASIHRGLRIISGATHAVAGVTSDRQRLLVWNSWDGKMPTADLNLYAMAKHRVADIAFV